MNTFQLSDKELSILKSMTLGMRIKYFRNKVRSNSENKQAFSATEVAKRIGISFQALSAIENDKTKNPSFDIISNLCKELSIPIDALTDEFYINKPDLIFTQNDRPIMIAEVKTPSIHEDNDFKVGYLMYQKFGNGDVRITVNEETSQSIDEDDFVNVLARLLSEIQLTNELAKNKAKPKYSSDNKNPYNKALDIFFSMQRKDKDFPIFSAETWKNFFSKNKEEE
jgi:transcriptional regulator with XRE-family HTH domain